MQKPPETKVKADKPQRKATSAPKVELPVIKKSEEYLGLSIDFQDHSDLYNKLETMAKTEFRTPPQQVLFLISQADKILKAAERREA